MASFMELPDIGVFLRTHIAQTMSYDCSKAKSDLEIQFKSPEQTILETAESLVRFGRIPEMRLSEFSLADAQVLISNIRDYFKSPSVTAVDLISWMMKTSYHESPSKAIRDIQCLQNFGLVECNIQIVSIIPETVPKALKRDLMKAATKFRYEIRIEKTN